MSCLGIVGGHHGKCLCRLALLCPPFLLHEINTVHSHARALSLAVGWVLASAQRTGYMPREGDATQLDGASVLSVSFAGATGASDGHEDAAASLSGRFIGLKRKGRFDEPTFENTRSHLYIYQHKRGEWVIGSRRGGTSYRARLTSGSLQSEASIWSVYDGSAWTKLRLACRRVGDDDDAEPRLPPAPMVVVACRFDNIAGLYRRRGSEGETESGGVTLQCEVGQYWNAEDGKVLWHNPRAKGGGRWMISDPSGVAGASDTKFSSLVASGPASAELSPEEADWTRGNNHLSMQAVGAYHVERNVRAVEFEEGRWCDADFPADASSIGAGLAVGGVASEEIPWVRAQALLPPAELPKLFNKVGNAAIYATRARSKQFGSRTHRRALAPGDTTTRSLLPSPRAPASSRKPDSQVEPDDILQGALGDCWLLAAIAAVAEFPRFVEERVFITRGLDAEDEPGKYRLRLFDAAAAGATGSAGGGGEAGGAGGGSSGWVDVVIDDRIPCDPTKRDWFATPTPVFAGNNGAELWVMLLEKAFAKFAGSCESLACQLETGLLTPVDLRRAPIPFADVRRLSDRQPRPSISLARAGRLRAARRGGEPRMDRPHRLHRRTIL